jgi:anti-anti-sigma factor
MEITTRALSSSRIVIRLDGRLDAHTAKALQETLDQVLADEAITMVLINAEALRYLSSAGIRVVLSTLKTLRRRDGDLVLTGLNDYCHSVLEIAGFADSITRFDDLPTALAHFGEPASEPEDDEHLTPTGAFSFFSYSNDACRIRVLGHIEDVLWSRITADHIHSKRFSHTEYSIGLGALGDRLDDYLGVLGEMITIGGTMVWLPTDGNDTPDYLIPRTDAGQVKLRTGFNASLEGRFNETALFVSNDPQGSTMTAIYRALFDLAKERRDDFKGALELTLLADMTEVYGSGVIYSTVLTNQPSNGKMITDPENFSAWFEVDKTPRHRDVTGLLTGLGVDRTMDLSHYNQERLQACFYVNPANQDSTRETLHNHGVFFTRQSFDSQETAIDDAIRKTVEQGEFVDMRHLLDGSRVKQALIGIAYVQDFIPDPDGQTGHH